MVKVDICAGCGETHEDMEFFPLPKEEVFTRNSAEYTHYGLCHRSGKIIYQSKDREVVIPPATEFPP
jgi:hypothetical protein